MCLSCIEKQYLFSTRWREWLGKNMDCTECFKYNLWGCHRGHSHVRSWLIWFAWDEDRSNAASPRPRNPTITGAYRNVSPNFIAGVPPVELGKWSEENVKNATKLLNRQRNPVLYSYLVRILHMNKELLVEKGRKMWEVRWENSAKLRHTYW